VKLATMNKYGRYKEFKNFMSLASIIFIDFLLSTFNTLTAHPPKLILQGIKQSENFYFLTVVLDEYVICHCEGCREIQAV
jgi:hypothetical protein